MLREATDEYRDMLTRRGPYRNVYDAGKYTVGAFQGLLSAYGTYSLLPERIKFNTARKEFDAVRDAYQSYGQTPGMYDGQQVGPHPPTAIDQYLMMERHLEDTGKIETKAQVNVAPGTRKAHKNASKAEL